MRVFSLVTTMMILSRQAKDRVKVSLLHGGTKVKVTIARAAEWHLIRDRLDDTVADALSALDESEFIYRTQPPTVRLSFTCDLSDVTDEREFEEYLTAVHRIMHRQHRDDVQLTVLVNQKLRSSFDSVEWSQREACAAGHQTTLAVVGGSGPIERKALNWEE